MASNLVDLVKITATGTGTGAITLGSAVAGYRGVEALTNGKIYSYSVQQNGSWEYGRCTFLSSTNQIIRAPIDSSNGGVAIDLKQNAQISFTALAEDLDAVQLSVDAVNAAAQTQLDAAATAADRIVVEAGAATVVYGQQVYPNAYASTLPKGVTALSINGIGTGSGGTPGIYSGGVSGGPTGFAWTYTIGSDGKIASYEIINPGLESSSTVPTLSYPSGSVTGATSPTATVNTLIEAANSYWAVSSDGTQLLLWQNDGTSTPAAVLDPSSAQVSIYVKAALDAMVALARHYANDSTDADVPGGSPGDRGAKFYSVQFAEFFSFALSIMGKAVVLADPASGVKLADVDVADGQINFYPKVTVPAGNWPLSSLGSDVTALMPFQITDSLLLSAFRIVSSDGYVLLDIPRDATNPISAFVDHAQFADAIGTVNSTILNLTTVGDSMTAYGSGIMDTLPALVSERTVYTSSEGGERTDGIAVSFGVPGILTLVITGNALPTSGTVVATPNISFLNSGQCSRVSVTTQTGASIECEIYNSSGTYYLRPISYPASALRVQNPAPARVVSLQLAGTDATGAQALDPLYDTTAIFRAGRNDVGYDKSYNGAAIVAYIEQMAGLMRSGRYLVLGPTNGYGDVPTADGGSGAMTEAQGQATLDNVVDINGRLRAAFPDRFVSVIENFAALGNTTDFTVNGATYTVLNSSVSVDGTHENTTGKTATSNLIVSELTARGF